MCVRIYASPGRRVPCSRVSVHFVTAATRIRAPSSCYCLCFGILGYKGKRRFFGTLQYNYRLTLPPPPPLRSVRHSTSGTSFFFFFLHSYNIHLAPSPSTISRSQHFVVHDDDVVRSLSRSYRRFYFIIIIRYFFIIFFIRLTPCLPFNQTSKVI